LEKKLLITIIIFSICKIFILSASGQGRDNLWLYGAGFQNDPKGIIDFISGSPVVDTMYRTMNIEISNTNISDSSGNLLFYTNGCFIANAINDTMLNGGGLNPGQCTDDYCQHGVPLMQGDLILPIGDGTSYYLIHETCTYLSNGIQPIALYYSIVDMSLDNGKGAVVSKNNIIVSDTMAMGAINAVKHANGRDWWVIAPNYKTDVYHILLLTPYGFILNTTQQIGSARGIFNWPYESTFSPDGSYFAIYYPDSTIDLLSFDRCSGNFYDYHQLTINEGGGFGLEFSPNSRLLYITSDSNLYQFDLYSPNIQNSQILVGSYDGFESPPGTPTSFLFAKLASDNKIYIITPHGSAWMHVINSPDSIGLSCNFQQHAIDLLVGSKSVPNHPNYQLETLDGICDSLSVTIPFEYSTDIFVISPNPFRNKIKILYSKNYQDNRKQYTIKVSNIEGEILYIDDLISNTQEINLSFLNNGVYILYIQSNNSIITRRLVKID